jgi:hypothetical protein
MITVLLLVTLGFEWTTRNLDSANSFGQSGFGFVVTILVALMFWMFPLVGAVITRHKPRNPIGWLLLAVGLGWALLSASGSYGDYGFKLHPGSLPATAMVASLGQWVWAPPVAITGVFLLLVYPDGHLLSRRWRWVAYLCGFSVVMCVIIGVLNPGPMKDAGFPGHDNPFGVQALKPIFDLFGLVVLLIPLSIIAAVVSMVLRFRRAGSVERLQIKWLAVAGGLSGLLYSTSLIMSALLVPRGHPDPTWLSVLMDIWFLSLSLIPVAIGIAVLRYKLFEIDVIIRRTLIYGALVAALAVTYLAGVVLIGALLRGLTGSSGTLAITVSTLIVAVGFQPLRGVIQRAVDRRFYRSGYDAQVAIDDFSERLREQIDLDALCRELQAVVTGTVQPVHASVWLRHDDGISTP